MRGLVLFFVFVASAYAASISNPVGNNVSDSSVTPLSDAFDVLFNQARSAFVGVYNLFAIPFANLNNSSSQEQPMLMRSMLIDPFQGLLQSTNRVIQKATDVVINTLNNNAQEPNSDPLLRILQQAIGKRANATDQPLQLLQQILMPNRETITKHDTI